MVHCIYQRIIFSIDIWCVLIHSLAQGAPKGKIEFRMPWRIDEESCVECIRGWWRFFMRVELSHNLLKAFWVFTRGESKEPSHKREEIHQQLTWKREVCNFIDWITGEYRKYRREPGRPSKQFSLSYEWSSKLQFKHFLNCYIHF